MSISHAITPSLTWVGVQDPHLRIFDIVMETQYGTTYNSYLLKGSEKTALFETAKDKFCDSYIQGICSETSLDRIDYIIVNHTEPDHSGAISKLLKLLPNVTIVGSNLAIKYLRSITNTTFNSLVVKDGDTLSLGDKTIQFFSVPFLHWPDTIYSYIQEDRTLITCDSFGAHYCCDTLFQSDLTTEAKEDYLDAFQYYYNMIMGPFKPYVLKALQKIASLELDFICPSHGLVLDKSNIETFKNYYQEWSTPIESSITSIVIPYVSAYGYTKELAEAIATGVSKALPDAKVSLHDLSYASMDAVLEKIGTCDGLILGSSTILADTLPQIWQILISLNPIIHNGKYAACFGSYGWSGEATKHISERYKQLKFKTPLEPFNVCFKPSEEDLASATEFGVSFANALPKK
ncbi:MAG: FprA family A-type flavoprotein [Cellulosilyticaceae bacterium]